MVIDQLDKRQAGPSVSWVRISGWVFIINLGTIPVVLIKSLGISSHKDTLGVIGKKHNHVSFRKSPLGVYSHLV